MHFKKMQPTQSSNSVPGPFKNQSGLILVTGAAGFVGTALLQLAHERQQPVRGATRISQPMPAGIESVAIGHLDLQTDWSAALAGCETVIHLAARVHVMRESSAWPLQAFCRTNALATAHLARSAAAAGVRRLVYASSVKVHGEATHGSQHFSEIDDPAPQDFYAVSKWQAEQALHQVARETGLEVVIARPPLLYGPNVRGNFLQMLKAVDKEIPLPFLGLNNQRHLLHVRNFADALLLCAAHPDAAGNTYLLADESAVSTTSLLCQLAVALDVKTRLLAFPEPLLHLAGRCMGRAGAMQRLLGSLQIDSAKIRQTLRWTPPLTLAQGFADTALWYRTSQSVSR